ncbi:toprim domain-containing protein [Quadrisphaera sp. INWT6]|uniref:toprim domain-containing protein n=1 Tax=Quadrisphaera sp. INWT6 TaxID=2596917 RepID=UPI001D878895|nr:toprim domain-containing protein [Quadrisphaera sp. INWT6]MBF5082387.1 toprim domain-containing protein [Quadrisphaera sp. INWT6]
MSEGSNDPLDEAAAQLAHLARALLSASEVGLRIHATRTARRTGTPAVAVPEPRRPRGEEDDRDRAVAPATSTSRSPRRTSAAHPARTSTPVTPPSGRRPAGAPHAPRPSTRGPASSRLLGVHRDALDFFREQERPAWATDMLRDRGLTAAWEPPWSAGYAPAGWTQLTQHLRSRGWDDEVLLAAGLSRRSRTGNLIDHFRDRIVLPLRRADGQVIGFVGRCAPGGDPRTPKYLNSPASGVYDKSATLFGLAEGRAALTSGAVPVLVEGPMDAIAVAAVTGEAFVGLAPCGTSLTRAHVDELGRVVDLASSTVVVATDHDAAGDAAAVKAFERIAGRCAGQLRAGLPEGLDPSDVLRREGPAGLREALTTRTRPLLDVAVDHRLMRWADQLQWVQGRVRAARHVAPLIAQLKESERGSAVTALAQRLDLMESTVSDAVAVAVPELSREVPPDASTSRRIQEGSTPTLRPPAATTAPPHTRGR